MVKVDCLVVKFFVGRRTENSTPLYQEITNSYGKCTNLTLILSETHCEVLRVVSMFEMIAVITRLKIKTIAVSLNDDQSL